MFRKLTHLTLQLMGCAKQPRKGMGPVALSHPHDREMGAYLRLYVGLSNGKCDSRNLLPNIKKLDGSSTFLFLRPNFT